MYKNRNSLWLPLLFGTFSMTQINFVGSIGISELVCYIAAPFVFAKNIPLLRRDGFMPVIWLSILSIIGCCLASAYNSTAIPLFLKGFAVTYSLFALPVCIHHMLRSNLDGLKWIFLGICISRIINVFAFRQGFEVGGLAGGIEDANTAEMIMSGPLFWLQRLGGFIVLPVKGWYFSTPISYSIVAPLIMTVFTILTTETGRSALLYSLGGVVLIMIGRKSIQKMVTIQRNLLLWGFVAVLLVFCFSTAYQQLAISGYLNEKAQQKYEHQTRGKSGIKAILMGGRSELFMGIYACTKNPFWGFGPWNQDEHGYNLEFLEKYGDEEAYEEYAKGRARMLKYGYKEQVQSHSHIIGFWVRYGLLALPFWLYIMYCMYRHCRNNMAAIPQWYGYFALALPAMAWHIVFSPYGGRVDDCLFIVCLLMANAVRRGTVQLPIEMIAEIKRKDPSAFRQFS